jgi:hypothetical protein
MLSKEGVFIFKKILFLTMSMMVLFSPTKIKAAGHQDFQEIILPKYSFAKLRKIYE